MSRVFLFESSFQIGFETKQLKVYRNDASSCEIYTVYTCCFDIDEDGNEVYAEILKDGGRWYDSNSGLTNLSEKLGELIDASFAAK